MITYNGFYILDETDFITHFLLDYRKFSAVNSTIIEKFDKEDKSYISFKRKIIAYNLLNPDNSWETKLSKECLKNLNELRFKQKEYTRLRTYNRHYQLSFYKGELIFFNNKKGEVINEYTIKGVILYDIKVGKEKIEKIYPSELKRRTDVREHLKSIPENLSYKRWRTEKLLSELAKARKSRFNYYAETGDDLPYWQLKKELALRPHIKRKNDKLNKKY